MATTKEKDIRDILAQSGVHQLDSLVALRHLDKTLVQVSVTTFLSAIKNLTQDGREVEISRVDNAIKWRLKGDEEWQELVSLSEITGPPGNPPVFSEVVAKKGVNPSGEITRLGDDEHGNPQYRLSVTLPQGDEGKTPILQKGTVTTLLPSQDATFSIVRAGVDSEQNPIYSVSLGIPKGEPGSLGEGNAENLTVTFTEVQDRENINSGEKFSTLMGKIKKWFSSLHALAFSGKFSDISGKPTTLQGYGITDASPSDHNHDSVYAGVDHTHDYASTSHSHDGVYLKKSFYEGSNTVSSLSDLPIDKRVIKATLSSPSNLSLSGTLDEWKSIHVVAKATSEFSLPIPNSGGWKTNKELLSVKNGQIVELNIMYIHGTYIVLSNIL